MQATEQTQNSRKGQGRVSQRRALPALALLAFALLALACLALSAQASAAAPGFLLQMPPGTGAPGEGAGQMNFPRPVVAKPSGADKGHVYIAEVTNNRIAEYTAWGLFVKAWGWGVEDGEAKLETCGPAEPEEAPPADLCRAGSAGGGKGQFNHPVGLALDPSGNIYVLEKWSEGRSNYRVQKFNPSGEFLLTFGGDVNKTKVEEGTATQAEENLCTAASGDVCQAGTEGTGPGSFGEGFFDTISYSPAENAIVIGDIGRIEEFNLDGTLKKEIPFEGALEAFEGKAVSGLDVDAAGAIYLSIEGVDDVYKLAPNGEPLEPGRPGASKFAVEAPHGVAVDAEGDVYAVAGLQATSVSEFAETGEQLVPTEEEEESGKLFPYTSGVALPGIATNVCAGSEAPGNLYVTAFSGGNGAMSFVNAYGSPPAGCEPPPPAAPTIVKQYAASAGADFARLRAEINPHYWSDTSYHLEYGAGRCSEGGCDQRLPLADSRLTTRVLNEALATETITLPGLSPATTYHYRFVASSEGGGPVYGAERTFRTLALPGAAAPCPANEAFRNGPGAALPDCRAYELVSPLEKQGASPGLLPATKSFFAVNQSAESGERFTYSAMNAFADPQSAPYISQYLSSRDPVSGWSTASISPPRSTRTLELQRSLSNEFKAFSPDLCQAWLVHNSDSTLAPGAIPGYSNLYRRSNCQGAAAYEAITTVPPAEGYVSAYQLNPLGFSAGGAETAFAADGRLSPDAPTLPTFVEGLEGKLLEMEVLLYVEGPGGLRYACYLPSGKPNQTACSAGMMAGDIGRSSAVQNALSGDGSRLFWTAYEGTDEISPKGVPGKIYLSSNPDRPQSARLHGSGAGRGDLLGHATAKCSTSKFSFTVSGCQWSSGDFGPGQEVSGPCLAAETTVASVAKAEGKMTLSKKPSASQSECEITGAASALVRNVTAEFGEFAAGQEFTGPGAAPGTRIEAAAAGTLTLSAPPSQTTTGAAIEATSECSDPEAACTIPVSGQVSPEPAQFWGASEDGSKVIFKFTAGAVKDDLYEFDMKTKQAHLIAEGVEGPMGMSGDLSRVYFSSTDLLGQGASEGAQAGAHNLYLYDAHGGGSFAFVMKLADTDLVGTETRPGAVTAVPTRRSSDLSVDGTVATFVSAADPTPTGYDNTDVATGRPDQEVYRYDAESHHLSCISCNPTGARPIGAGPAGEPSSASQLPQRHAPLVVPHPLSAAGNRLFFESHEALVPRDTNGTWDVYEWEAPQTGSCTASSPTYIPGAGGCVDLISSGTSPEPSRFLDADPSGRNVFIDTFAGLVRVDYGLYDVYDARIDGGFPEPPGLPAACEGEACQGPAAAPDDPTPASASFQGAGNLREAAAKPNCRRPKVKKRGRCVKRKARHHRHHRRHAHRHASRRGAGR